MDYGLLADEVLLKFLKISDELAFKEIYLRYWKNLFTTVMSKINNKEVAEDIVQGVFVEIWANREKQAIGNIAAYLNASVKYRVINYIRSVVSRKAQLPHILEKQKNEENSVELAMLVKEWNAAINEAVGQLPQKTQTIFRLSRFEHQSNKDISRMMDLSEKAVEYHISQSLKSLRFYLKDFILVDLLVFLFLLFF